MLPIEATADIVNSMKIDPDRFMAAFYRTPASGPDPLPGDGGIETGRTAKVAMEWQ